MIRLKPTSFWHCHPPAKAGGNLLNPNLQSRSDYLCGGRARAGSAADRWRSRVRDVADGEDHLGTRLVLAVRDDIAVRVRVQLTAKHLRVRLEADAHEHAAHGHAHRL